MLIFRLIGEKFTKIVFFCPIFVLIFVPVLDKALHLLKQGREAMYKLIVFVPQSAKETLKSALFEAGAGGYGAYESCSWEVLGEGQFKPKNGANPYIGVLDTIEVVPEYRLEMLVDKSRWPAVQKVLYRIHPYEEPVFDLIEVVDIDPKTGVD